MGAGIHFIVALTKMKNSLHIVELKVHYGAVVVVGLLDIIKVAVEELCKADTDVLSFADIDFKEFFLSFLADYLFRNWDISFVCIADDQVFKKTAKPMERYL